MERNWRDRNCRDSSYRDHWLDVSRRWEARLADLRLDGLARALTYGLKPLGPAAAHLLWIAQPLLGLTGHGGAVGGLADLLYEPGDPEEAGDRDD
jgi:hypothetical protein